MVKVKFNRCISLGKENANPGDVVDIDEKLYKELLDRGAVELVDKEEEKKTNPKKKK